MKSNSILSVAQAAACLAGALGVAPALEAQELENPRNRVYLGAGFSFNISASVRNLPVAPNAAPQYDDGLVAADISHNAGGKTWNWGYQSSDQVVGANLQFHSATSPRDGSSQRFFDDPHPGFEIGYARVLGRLSLSQATKLSWGLEGGFGSLDLNLKRQDTVVGTVSRTTYNFAYGGILVPLAPYAGGFGGPGPVIDAAANATTTDPAVAASSTQAVTVDGLVYGLKLGPFLELPLSHRFALAAGGGLRVVNAEADFSYSETITVSAPGRPPPPRTGKFSNSGWLAGFYGRVTLNFALSDALGIYVGGQYQHLGDLTVRSPAKEATVGLGGTLEAVAGIRFVF